MKGTHTYIYRLTTKTPLRCFHCPHVSIYKNGAWDEDEPVTHPYECELERYAVIEMTAEETLKRHENCPFVEIGESDEESQKEDFLSIME